VDEKIAMGDGRFDQDRLIKAIKQHARDCLLIDMEALAKQSGSLINAVMLGTIAGSGRLPIGIELLEAAIRAVCEPIFDKPLREVSFGRVLLRLFQTSRRFGIEVQPQLVLLQKTLLNIEGLGLQLDPELDLWKTAKPFLEKWMNHHKKENPLFTHFDEILEIAKKYDVTISLGDSLRPGSIADSGDKAQLAELKTLGDLVKRCWKAEVQVMVEGPGHVPLNEIELQMKIQKELCHNAPFYVLGPLVCDIGAGYDHWFAIKEVQ